MLSNTRFHFRFVLFLRLFEKHVFAQGGVELHKLYLTFCGLSILTSPDDVIGLRGFKP